MLLHNAVSMSDPMRYTMQTHADVVNEARACNTSEDRTVLSWATIHECHEGGKSHELRPYVELHSESDSIRE